MGEERKGGVEVMGDTASVFVTFSFKIHQTLHFLLGENFNPRVIGDGLIYQMISILQHEALSFYQ